MTTLQWPHRQQKLTHVQTGAAHCDHFTMATHTTTATKKPTSAAGAQCQENTTGLSGAVGASVQAALRGKANTSNANNSVQSELQRCSLQHLQRPANVSSAATTEDTSAAAPAAAADGRRNGQEGGRTPPILRLLQLCKERSCLHCLLASRHCTAVQAPWC